MSKRQYFKAYTVEKFENIAAHVSVYVRNAHCKKVTFPDRFLDNEMCLKYGVSGTGWCRIGQHFRQQEEIQPYPTPPYKHHISLMRNYQ